MVVLAAIAGILLIGLILLDAFETILLPRRVARRFRLVRLFFQITYSPWAAAARRTHSRELREAILGVYGPLSMVLLLGFWALGLCVGFGFAHWAAEQQFHRDHTLNLIHSLYVSGTTFFTLGLGDIVPGSELGRFLGVIEAGMGFGFLAIVIGYLPVLYQLFSAREIFIGRLDALAGSPPSAVTIITRVSENDAWDVLREQLRAWETWSAELLETHLSYPVLCFYRSQHDNQSWLAALTFILDVCAVLLAGAPQERSGWQAKLTFAMARHALVDLTSIFRLEPPTDAVTDRLPPEAESDLIAALLPHGVDLTSPESRAHLREMRNAYEPFVHTLAAHLIIPVPAWQAASSRLDNWLKSPWGRSPTTLLEK